MPGQTSPKRTLSTAATFDTDRVGLRTLTPVADLAPPDGFACPPTNDSFNTQPPLRAGSDLAFLGGLVRFALEHGHVFRDYVVAYTNAAVLLRDDVELPADLGGLFSGWDEAARAYNPRSWFYRGAEAAAHDGRCKDRGGERQRFDGSHPPELDPTLEHPRCVYQVLRRHFDRKHGPGAYYGQAGEAPRPQPPDR